MKTITSRHNPLVSAFRDLAERPDVHGRRVLLDGAHLVRDAVTAGYRLEQVCVESSHLDRGTDAGLLAATLDQQGVDVAVMPEAVFALVSPVRTPSGIVAVAKRPHGSAGTPELLEPHLLVLIGVGIQDPGNVGALIRVAEAAGADSVFVTGESANPFSWKALRGSMGSALRLPVLHEVQTAALLQLLQRGRVRTVAAVPHGGTDPDQMRWTGRVAIVVGGEGSGLSDDIVAQCDERVTIPMAPPVESLNVAVATAILLYAARRQRLGNRDS
jgi:TrmH family RNA methyltransferase